MKNNKIAIIGGHGQMGKMLDKKFSHAGMEVLSLDQPLPEEDLSVLLRPCSLVILAVPISVFSQVVELIAPNMASGAVLADICSVKVTPMRAMEKSYSGPVVGTHPLFGPEPGHGDELKVALCPGKGADTFHVNMVEDVFSRAGMRTFVSSDREHDQAMACIQSLNFVTTISYFASLPQDIDLKKFSTPSFMRRVKAARKMINEDAFLFTSLAEDNPYTGQMIRRFKSFLNLSAAGELELLQDKALWWWQGEDNNGG